MKAFSNYWIISAYWILRTFKVYTGKRILEKYINISLFYISVGVSEKKTSLFQIRFLQKVKSF